ncbi:hypothetical protein Tco_0772651 [Tanacetum coccineum]|uniref:Uncharacterized protein n=1 Tax=Tanacetum coccineum TaxID=301880 RepID=A0ABQ4ZIP2_9ASTR
MTEPISENYISVTRKNFLSGDNERRMVEKSFLEIQGKFLVKIRDNTFNGTIGENAVENIENFLEVVRPLKIKGVSQDKFRLSIFPISLSEMEADEDHNSDKMNIATEIFKIEGILFDYEIPLCKAFNEFNYLLKIDTDLFTFDVQKIKTYEEYEYELNNNMEWGLKEPWSDDESDALTDGVLKEEALMHKARFEESRGDAAPGVMKFYPWNYGTNNAGNTQDNQGPREKQPTHDLSVCQVRRFDMIRYSFDADDEYVAVMEHEYFDHSRTNLDECQAYRELFRIMDEGWLVTKVKDE